MRHRLVLVSGFFLLLLSVKAILANQFQNGLMLGFILHQKIHPKGGPPPPPPCKPAYELVKGKGGKLELRMKECPENIIETLLRKSYGIEKYRAKAHVVEAKGNAKANVIHHKSLLKLPHIFKPRP